MKSLSVIIICQDEAKNIRRCLESIKWADEIIVFDSGSRDETLAICREYTPHVFESDWPGFGIQKNRALAKARCEWVLSIDADEELTPELVEEIQSVLKAPRHRAYSLRRLLVFNDKIIRHGHGKDRVLRLFERGVGHFTEVQVHERLEVNVSVGKLYQPLLHYSVDNIEHLLNTMNCYSSLSADMKVGQGKQAGLLKALSHGLWMFIRIFFFKGGFLDGVEGFILAVSCGEGSYYRYIKMSYLQDRDKLTKALHNS